MNAITEEDEYIAAKTLSLVTSRNVLKATKFSLRFLVSAFRDERGSEGGVA